MFTRRAFALAAASSPFALAAATTSASAKVFVGNLSFQSVPPHIVSGSGRIQSEGDMVTVTLGQDFKTHDASNLFLLLHTAAKPHSHQGGETVRLGRLKKSSGTQNFNIGMPPSVFQKFNSVAVWDKTSKAVLGYAAIIR